MGTQRRIGRTIAVGLGSIGLVVGLLQPAAHASGMCQIAPSNFASSLPVGSTISVQWGGSVACPDVMSWINFFGNLYAPGGRFINSFTYTEYGQSSTDHIQTDAYNCKQTGPVSNEGSVTFTVQLGYNATRADGLFDYDERSYSVVGTCPLVRV